MTKVFVFGSNLAGRHGAGSAKEAFTKWGAKYGVGVGRQGRSYAIPTKDKFLRRLPLDTIESHVILFKEYALEHPDTQFLLVAVGCGLAGYKPRQIAPMFSACPTNVRLPREFKEILQPAEGIIHD